MMHKIVRHFSNNQMAVAFEKKAKTFKGVTYAKKYAIGNNHYACMVCSDEGFTEDVAKKLLGRGRNYAELAV